MKTEHTAEFAATTWSADKMDEAAREVLAGMFSRPVEELDQIGISGVEMEPTSEITADYSVLRGSGEIDSTRWTRGYIVRWYT